MRIIFGLIIFFIVNLALASESQQPSTKSTLTVQQLAVKRVIEAETAAFMRRDYEAWDSYWVQDDSIYIGVATPTLNEEIRDWKTYSAFTKGILAQGTITLNPATIQKTDWAFQMADTLAYVTFKENGNASTRILKKIDGKWKLIHTGVIYTEEYKKRNAHISTWEAREAFMKTQQ